MKLILSFIEYMNSRAEARREARISAYLSESADFDDLAFRIREIDRNAALQYAYMRGI